MPASLSGMRTVWRHLILLFIILIFNVFICKNLLNSFRTTNKILKFLQYLLLFRNIKGYTSLLCGNLKFRTFTSSFIRNIHIYNFWYAFKLLMQGLMVNIYMLCLFRSVGLLIISELDKGIQ